MNTSACSMGQRAPIAELNDGMLVLDSAGEEIGTVEFVKMGNPEAVTGEGQTAGDDGGITALIARTFGGAEPSVPPDEAARLVRLGFFKVDGKGMFAGDLYVAADEVATVREDTVYLNKTKADLAEK